VLAQLESAIKNAVVPRVDADLKNLKEELARFKQGAVVSNLEDLRAQAQAPGMVDSEGNVYIRTTRAAAEQMASGSGSSGSGTAALLESQRADKERIAKLEAMVAELGEKITATAEKRAHSPGGNSSADAASDGAKPKKKKGKKGKKKAKAKGLASDTSRIGPDGNAIGGGGEKPYVGPTRAATKEMRKRMGLAKGALNWANGEPCNKTVYAPCSPRLLTGRWPEENKYCGSFEPTKAEKKAWAKASHVGHPPVRAGPRLTCAPRR
jgi:hypothetical protein